MKIQVVATISSDGYLLKREIKTGTKFGKYSFITLRKRADFTLHKESSLITLLEAKRQSSDINYLAEATAATLELIKALFLYQLADVLILYVLPSKIESGFKLFDLTSPSDWVLSEEFSQKNGCQCKVYHKIK